MKQFTEFQAITDDNLDSIVSACIKISASHESLQIDALTQLYRILTENPRAYHKFTQKQLEILNLDKIIQSKDKQKSELAVKIAAHLVRFHGEVSKNDVCKSLEAISCFEKNEMVEVWAELKDLKR